MRTRLTAAILVAPLLGIFGCSGYSSPSPTGSDGLPAAPQGAVVINVVRENGAQSFSPNPATVPAGQLVSWHNVDTTTHHVVLNDGKLDAGNLPPGKYSPAMTLTTPGPYHCTIHPDMVGTIVSGQ